MNPLHYIANEDITLVLEDGSTKKVIKGVTLNIDRKTGQCEKLGGSNPWVGTLLIALLEELIRAGSFAPKPVGPDEDPARAMFQKLLLEILSDPGYKHNTTSVGTRQVEAGPFTVTVSTSTTIKARVALQWDSDKIIWSKDIRNPATPAEFRQDLKNALREARGLIERASEALGPRPTTAEAQSSRPHPDLSAYTERDPAFANKVHTVAEQLLRRPDLAACVMAHLQDTPIAGPWEDDENPLHLRSRRTIVSGHPKAIYMAEVELLDKTGMYATTDNPDASWELNTLGDRNHPGHSGDNARTAAKAYADEILRQQGVHLLADPPGFAAHPWKAQVLAEGRVKHVRYFIGIDPGVQDSAMVVIAEVTEKQTTGKQAVVSYMVYPEGPDKAATTGSTRHKDDPTIALNNAKVKADNLLETAGWRLEP
jgi:hypothetical protein